MWETLVRLWEFLVRDSGGVVAVFTIVLAFTTIIYVVVSVKLLKQSRNAFLADITLRVMGTCRKEIREIKKGEEKKVAAFARAWIKGYCAAFVKIDKRLGVDILNLFEICLDASLKEWLKEDKKVRKERERNRGSGIS